MDEKNKLRKKFATIWSDKNFPIQYKNTTCALTIKIETRTWGGRRLEGNYADGELFSNYGMDRSNTYDYTYYSEMESSYDYDTSEKNRAAAADIPPCFLTIISKVKCIVRSEPSKVSSDDPARKSNIVIVCVTVLITVVVISITVITAVIVLVKKRKKIVIVEKEVNDLYGTYHTQGIEYNLAIDENPRYNEDRDNADGNTNHYIANNPSNYELEDNNQTENYNETENNNGPNSPNGNVYYQL